MWIVVKFILFPYFVPFDKYEYLIHNISYGCQYVCVGYILQKQRPDQNEKKHFLANKLIRKIYSFESITSDYLKLFYFQIFLEHPINISNKSECKHTASVVSSKKWSVNPEA